MPHINAKLNEYAESLGWKLFDAAPKSVIAAVAVAMLQIHHDDPEFSNVGAHFIREWWTLHENGIVSQKPPFPKPAEEV